MTHPRPSLGVELAIGSTVQAAARVHDREADLGIVEGSRLNYWRRVATRYDRCPTVFFSAVALAATVIFWLLSMSPDPRERRRLMDDRTVSTSLIGKSLHLHSERLDALALMFPSGLNPKSDA